MNPFLDNQPFRSWGRVVRRAYSIARPRFLDQAENALAAGADRPASILAVGLGRSYGDSCLNEGGGLIDMSGVDRIIAFDPKTPAFRAEAGMSISAALQFLAPRGFFIPVTPGSRFVTLGGAVANDVHGKNHLRAGTFGAAVRAIGLRRSDGAALTLRPHDESGLFEATVAGLGLTGLIEWVEFGLERIGSTMLETEDIAFTDLKEYFDLMRASETAWEQRVAWIDCTRAGRGVLSRARWRIKGPLHAHRDRGALRLPFDLPGAAINPATLRMFNALYGWAKGARAGRLRDTPYEKFFYPLDSIGDWNRAYGVAGFFQYQCIVPEEAAPEAIADMLRMIARSGEGSALAVLKEFGPKRSPGLLSFPLQGTSLALDFRNRGAATLKLLAELDSVVRAAGGRLYPAKDGRMDAAMFQRFYPAWEEFARHVDPRFSSDFWRRVSAS